MGVGVKDEWLTFRDPVQAGGVHNNLSAQTHSLRQTRSVVGFSGHFVFVLCYRANWRKPVVKLKSFSAEDEGSVHSSAADPPAGAVDMLKLLWGGIF